MVVARQMLNLSALQSIAASRRRVIENGIPPLAAYFVLIGAAMLRLHRDVASIERTLGALWPRALLFSLAMFASFLAFGLHSGRQRARSAGIFVRIVAAVALGGAISGLSLFLIPDLWIGRGVVALAGLGAAVVAVMLHVTFARIIDERVFKGRVLVYGVGRNAETISQLRRRADRRGFVLIGFVRPPGESPGFFPAELAGFPAERVLDGGWGFPSSAGASTSMRLWWRSTTGVASFRSASSSSAASPGLM